MRYKKLGKTGLDVSVIGFGCNQIGSDKTGYKDFELAKDAVFFALDKGINYFDTADVYGDRKSEEWLGRILGPKRTNVIISTKAGLTGDGGRNGYPDHLRKSLENSLKKLKTDYIDIFYLHRPDPKVPLAESITAIDTLIKEGKARYGGVSQLDLKDLEIVKSSHAISCVQYCLNFFNFQTAYSVMPIIEEKNYGISTYSPMSSGWILKEKYYSLAKKRFPYLKPQYYRPEFSTFEAIVQATEKFKINMNQLALSWVLNHQGVHSIICGTSSCEQLCENIEVIDFHTTPDLIETVSNIVQRNTVEKHEMRRIIWNIGMKIRKWVKV